MKNLEKPIIISIIIGVVLILIAVTWMIVSINSNGQTLEIYDKNTGYRTTFKYSARQGYRVEEKEEIAGTFPEIVFINEKNNVKFELYYYETSNSIFERNKTLRSSNDNYTEYKFGDYDAYSYTAGEFLQSDVLLKKDENDRVLVLYIYMGKCNNESEANMNEIFNSKEVQKILKSIKFEEVSKEK